MLKHGVFLTCVAIASGSVLAQDSSYAGILQDLATQFRYNCARPGDLDLAVGLERIVMVSNCKVQIWDRGLTPTFRAEAYLRNGPSDSPAFTGGFFDAAESGTGASSGSGTGSRIFDPKAYWDAEEERFFVIACEHSHGSLISLAAQIGNIRIAISKDDTPDDFTSTHWHFVTVDYQSDLTDPGESFPDLIRTWIGEDYLHVAVGRQGPQVTEPSSQWDVSPSNIIFLPKAPLLSGIKPTTPYSSLRVLSRDGFDCDSDPNTPLPPCIEESNLLGYPRTYGLTTDAPLLIGKTEFPTKINDTVVQSDLLLASAQLSGSTVTYDSITVPLPAATSFSNKGTSTPVPTPLSPIYVVTPPVYHQPVYRNGSIWAAINGRPVIDDGTGTLIADPNDDRLVVYWYEIDPDGFPAPGSSPSIVQSGVLDPKQFPTPITNGFAIDPSVAVGADNTVVITFMVTSENEYPAIYRAVRYQTQPPNSMPNIAKVRQVSTARDPFLAADYTGTVPDPTDSCIYWGHAIQPEGGTAGTLVDLWESYLTQYRVCNSTQNSFADVDGDGEVTLVDYGEFVRLFSALDRRGDVNADGWHDVADVLRMDAEMADRGVRR